MNLNKRVCKYSVSRIQISMFPPFLLPIMLFSFSYYILQKQLQALIHLLIFSLGFNVTLSYQEYLKI